jgi:hypothetical protein
MRGYPTPDASLWLRLRFPNKINEEIKASQDYITAVLGMVCSYVYEDSIQPSIGYSSLFTPNAYGGRASDDWRPFPGVWDTKPYTGKPLSPLANEHPNDTPMSPHETNSSLGRFTFNVDDVTVYWRSDYDSNQRCFEWVGTLKVINTFGVSPDDPWGLRHLASIPAKYNENITIGSFPISGSGCCCPQFW